MRTVVALLVVLPALAVVAVHAVAGGGNQTKTDPCALATLEEVAEALAENVGPGQNDGIGDCRYLGTSGYTSQLQVSVDETPGRATFFDAQAKGGSMKPLEDIGDAALYLDSPAGFAQVMVLKDDVLMSITLSSLRVKDRLESATELARAAAERLGTMASLAKIPGLESLVGRWFADAGDSASGSIDRRSWEIDASGRWSMTSAPEYSGYMTAEDGRWEVETQQATFGGRYEIKDQDHFTTRGDLDAEFSRIPGGVIPTGVDPALFGIWSTVGLTGNASRGPIDPTLVGYWQAMGEEDDAPITYVLRVDDGGYVVLTVISALQGVLMAKDGELEIVPDDGSDFTATYKVLSPDAFETKDDTGLIRWDRRGTGIIPN